MEERDIKANKTVRKLIFIRTLHYAPGNTQTMAAALRIPSRLTPLWWVIPTFFSFSLAFSVSSSCHRWCSEFWWKYNFVFVSFQCSFFHGAKQGRKGSTAHSNAVEGLNGVRGEFIGLVSRSVTRGQVDTTSLSPALWLALDSITSLSWMLQLAFCFAEMYNTRMRRC